MLPAMLHGSAALALYCLKNCDQDAAWLRGYSQAGNMHRARALLDEMLPRHLLFISLYILCMFFFGGGFLRQRSPKMDGLYIIEEIIEMDDLGAPTV